MELDPRTGSPQIPVGMQWARSSDQDTDAEATYPLNWSFRWSRPASIR
jgi:hypothetical protein